MTPEVEDLSATVNKTVGVEASASELIRGFAAFANANADNPAAIRAYAAQLDAAADSLAADVAANPVPAA